MRSYSCPKCQGSMTQGFVTEHTHGGGHAVSNWVEGAPEKSFWTGVRLRGKTQYEIETWRCGRCGFLENYARG
jgi:ribosomal protein S27AE